jgi:hypothetical protein
MSGRKYWLGPASLGPDGSITVDTWNAFNVPASLLEICSLSSCSALSSTVAGNGQSFFFDPGTKVTEYGWTGDTNTTIAQSLNGTTPNGYTVTYNVPADVTGHNSQPITGTLTATVPSTFDPFFFPAGGIELYFAAPLPTNATWTATFKGQSGKTYTSPQPVSTSSTSLYVPLSNSMTGTALEQFKALTLQFTLPALSVTTSSSPGTGSFVITNVSNNNGGFCGFNC